MPIIIANSFLLLNTPDKHVVYNPTQCLGI
jgi:hypothetical protein